MNRESVGRIAARSYPVEIRAERGAELVGTLLDAGDDSRTAFVRQVASVIGTGLAARAREALTQQPAQIAICALAWAAVIVLVRSLVALLGFEVRATGHVRFPEGAFLTWILPALIVLLFTLKRTRISGILGVALIVGHLVENQAPMAGRVIPELVLPFAGFVLLALTPRRIPTPGRWVWLAPTAVLAYFFATQIGLRSGVDVIVPLMVALCLLPFQPPFAIGWGLAWSVPVVVNLLTVPGAGNATAFTIVLVSCTPLAVIAIGVGRLRVRGA
jgi:hypothetical protein